MPDMLLVLPLRPPPPPPQHPYTQGSKVFLVAPPLPTNLAAFEAWARSKKQGRTWLGNLLQGVTKVTLQAGDTLLLPPGVSHIVTLSPTIGHSSYLFSYLLLLLISVLQK